VTRLLPAALAAGILATVAPVAAHAGGDGFTGRCVIAAFNDTTPGAYLGGQRVWHAVVALVVVAPGDAGSASCWIKVNGVESKVFDATTVGGSVAAGAGEVTYTADSPSDVYICTHVTTSSGSRDDCVPASTPVASGAGS
jgi:hypothetical protein